MDQELIESLKNIKPLRVYKIGEAVFQIYQAKNLYHSVWNSGVLKKIVKTARRSYLRYGRILLTDAYDKNAAIYLCRTSYGNLEEWLCLRFVPGGTGRHLLEDLNQYVYDGKSIAEVIANKLTLTKNGLATKLVAISRLCGIMPYYRVNIADKDVVSPVSMKYTAQAFALINKDFFSEERFTYLVGVFRPEVLKKVLHFSSGLNFVFPDVCKILKCKPAQVRLDRNWLAYRFPGYFLNAEQLIKLLQRLIKEKKLNITFIKKYAKNFAPEIDHSKNYTGILKMISGISAVLLWKGKIPGSAISGEELRRLADRLVADGPKLKIIAVSSWAKQLNKIKVKEIYG